MTDPSHSPIRPLPVQGATHTISDGIDLRLLIPHGDSVRAPIHYSADVWDFAGYAPLVNTRTDQIDFQGVPPRWRPAVKDWTLLRMNPELASTGASNLNTADAMAPAAAAEKKLTLPSLFAYAGCFAVALTAIEALGRDSLGPVDWTDLARRLEEENPSASPATLAGYCRPLISLWTYRGLIGLPDMFGGRPFGTRTLEAVFKVPDSDLNVDRPSPEICGPVLGLSLWIIDNCAEDILSRLEHVKTLPDRSQRSFEEQVDAVNDQLLKWEHTGRPLPAFISNYDGKTVPSWSTFVKLAGCTRSVLPEPRGDARKTFERLRNELGIALEEDGFTLPITEATRLDGTTGPWIRGLPATKFNLGLDFWSCALAYSCAFVIAMLTTVRDRELAAIPHDCLVDAFYDEENARIPVTKMRGYLVKNRSSPSPATWIIADDVVRAVKLIHRLKAALNLTPRLHPVTGEEVLLHSDLGRNHRASRSPHTLKLANEYLSWFRQSGAHLAENGFIPPLPTLPHWLPHRTIRITGIEAYASQPWGDALAAAQAHWSNRTVAEGYYGHLPNSVYIADPESIEEVRQISKGQSLLDAAMDAAAHPTSIQGNGVRRLIEVLEAGHTEELLNGPVTGRQLQRLAKDNPNVFIGELTICVHGPGGLCGNETEAEFKLCRPGACRNSAMTAAQRARVELRRRGFLRGTSGVFDRARRKIESDLPELAAEFVALTDAELRDLILEDLPGRFRRAAEGAVDEHP
ncbi:MAG: hypothetical protein ABWX92_08470 [Mycetocola sp.]